MRETEFINQIISEEFGTDRKVSSVNGVAGGCISTACQVTLRDGETFFIKLNRLDFIENFKAEQLGLLALEQTKTVKVPTPIAVGSLESHSYLVLEWIETEVPRAEFSARLGEALANLHAQTSETAFGFTSDNFIGSTPQQNTLTSSWADFFVEHRLWFQLDLAIRNQYSFAGLDLEKILSTIRSELPTTNHASLIHGDLWSGNYLVGSGNHPVLIDPATYWADREAEFGILTMFGGFDDEFFSAYRTCLPLEAGFEQRLPIYQLYHFLNHLNLFGSSYLNSSRRILKQFA